MTIGDLIKTHRKNLNLTQDELAELVGLSPSAIRMYETNKREPKKDSLQKIAEVLNVPVKEFIYAQFEDLDDGFPVEMNIGKKIKEYRKKMDMTQKELGEKINKSEVTIRKYESGQREPKMNVIQEICHALNVSMSDFGKELFQEYDLDCEVQEKIVTINIGDKIKLYRKEKQLTQKALGALIGKSYEAIRKYENGERQPPIKVIQEISNVLNIPVTEFLMAKFDELNCEVQVKSVEMNYIKFIYTTGENEAECAAHYKYCRLHDIPYIRLTKKRSGWTLVDLDQITMAFESERKMTNTMNDHFTLGKALIMVGAAKPSVPQMGVYRLQGTSYILHIKHEYSEQFATMLFDTYVAAARRK